MNTGLREIMSGTGRKISRRLFVILLMVAVIPICIMGYGTYKAAQNVLIHMAFMHLETIAQDHVNHLNTWFGERVNDIRVLSLLPTIRDICSPYCTMEAGHVPPAPEKSALLGNILALTRGKSPSYESMHLFTPAGVLLASTDPNSEEVRNLDRKELFSALQETSGEPMLGTVHEHANRRWYVHLVAPIRVGDGRAAAVILAVLDVSRTLDPIMTDRAGLGKTGETYLVNRDGRILTRANHLTHAEALDQAFDTYGIRAALDGRNGSEAYTNYAGREVLGSYLWLPGYNWGLLAEMEKDEILSPLEHIRTAVIATTAVVGVLCLLVALVMSRRVSMPIIRVAEAAREIAEGRLEQRIAFTGSDEVGILAESFNAMAGRLSKVIASLRQKEESLRSAYDELVQTQKQLVQSEKMAAIGELVASVVHEMRNPLSSVKLNLQIIGRTLPGGSLLCEHFQIALDQVGQLERMFTDLLDYSRPLAIQKVPVHVAEILEESLRQLAAQMGDQNIRIVKRLNGSLPPVAGDPDKIRQVLVNVIKNAVEATGRDGTVEIGVDLANSGKSSFLNITVADDGPGISQQDLNRVYQPFFTTKRKGTGLGLPIVRKIMEAHGSSIMIASEEGEGTTVRLQFQGAEDGRGARESMEDWGEYEEDIDSR